LIGFGLLRPLAHKRADGARARQKIGHIGVGG